MSMMTLLYWKISAALTLHIRKVAYQHPQIRRRGSVVLVFCEVEILHVLSLIEIIRVAPWNLAVTPTRAT